MKVVKELEKLLKAWAVFDNKNYKIKVLPILVMVNGNV